MADLFRLMLDDSKDIMPVQSEVKIARKYLKLEKLRLEQRLSANWTVRGVTRQAKTPVLMLQLLLENAIRNGVELLSEGGEIKITIIMENDTLLVSVRSPVPQAHQDKIDGRDEALDNIRLRLRDLYGDSAQMDIQQDSKQYSVEIRHPAFGGV
jgi:two-component system sensor histidine kinase AlgZ